jgi:hypothetical protein
MVFNLDPLDISLDFERRMYRLGDTINATVSLISSGGVRIREASLNLVAEVKRTEVKAGWALGMAGSPNRYNASRVPTRGTPVQTVSMETGYSAPFLSSTSLKVGRPGKYKVALELGPRLPRVVQLSKELELDTNSSLSIEKWWLEVQVDVVMGSDQSVRKEIDVSLS